MKIVIFHRPFKQKKILSASNNNEDVGQESEPVEKEKGSPKVKSGFSDFEYSIKNREQSILLSFTAKFNGSEIKDRLIIPLAPWSQLGVFFNFSTSRLELVDLAVLGTAILKQDNYIARLLSTDSEAMIYLRGRIKDVPSYKNILVADNENSAIAFSKYSSKAKHFFEKTVKRNTSLSKIDVYKYLCLLETQVDVLTKIVLDSNLVSNKELKSLLEDSVGCSACLKSSHATLEKRIQYKKQIQFCQEYC